MKKYFFKYMSDEIVRFMALGFVVFSPLSILFIIRLGIKGSFILIAWTAMAYVWVITLYRRFEPDKWNKEKKLKQKFDSLSLKKKEKLLGNIK